MSPSASRGPGQRTQSVVRSPCAAGCVLLVDSPKPVLLLGALKRSESNDDSKYQATPWPVERVL